MSSLRSSNISKKWFLVKKNIKPQRSQFYTTTKMQLFFCALSEMVFIIDVINVYNVYKKTFVNAFIILSTFISIKITWAKRSKIMTATKIISEQDNST